MNPEIEAEKTAIALNLQQQITNVLIADLAAARVEIRQLKAKLPPDGVAGSQGPVGSKS